VIQHVVLFRFRRDATDAAIGAAGDALLAMRGRIPAARSVAWGRNLAASATEWPWILMVECADMDAVAEYVAHPVHRETVDRFIAPIREARLAVDVETGG
jgi:hypothetical protein